LIEEYQLELKVTLVASGHNLADALTRVPHKWLKMVNGRTLQSQLVCCAAANSLSDERIAEIHHTTGHRGVKRTVYFVRKMDRMQPGKKYNVLFKPVKSASLSTQLLSDGLQAI